MNEQSTLSKPELHPAPLQHKSSLHLIEDFSYVRRAKAVSDLIFIFLFQHDFF